MHFSPYDRLANYGLDIDGLGARALSEAELKEREMQQALSGAYRNYTPSLADINAMVNFQRPVHVNPGWTSWYAHGNELV